MPGANVRLAAALEILTGLQQGGRHVFAGSEIPRTARDRLKRQGFLQPIVKGWWMSTSPPALPGDTTPWYASFWEFCARYCNERFGEEWHLSPEQSLLLHAEQTAIPPQVVVYSPRASNNALELPFGTGLYTLHVEAMPPARDVVVREGVRIFSVAAALMRVPEAFFVRHPVAAQVVLAAVRDAADVLARLLAGGHSVRAGRVAGAFRRVGRPDVADEIAAAMRAAAFEVRESDPFEPAVAIAPIRGAPPVVARLTALWQASRERVVTAFRPAPGLPADPGGYLKAVEDAYVADAYHSLSIEGYRVSPALVERVRAGGWDPMGNADDRQDRDALAARGYWQAFQAVQDGLRAILGGAAAGPLVREAHREWYRQMFQPFVAAGLLGREALAGYRNDAVYLRGSRHVPPRWEVVRDAMPALFDLLEAEPDPAVRAVLGHWLAGYIHPYPDGNGRIARFLMNCMLASGGYPWIIIEVGHRNAYLTGLEAASVHSDIGPFADFVSERVRAEMWGPPSSR